MHTLKATRRLSLIAVTVLMLSLMAPLVVSANASNEAVTIRLAQGDLVESEASTGPNAKRKTTVRTLTNPLGTTDIPGLVGRGVQLFTGLSGSVALLMFVYGGFMWLTSGGNPDRVQKGKKVFIWATIGLLVIFGSYAILNAVFSAIGAS